MLNVVLKMFADFENKHGLRAEVLDISDRHFRMLVEQYPGIFSDKADLDLGFMVCIHQETDAYSPSVRTMNVTTLEAEPIQSIAG